MTKKEIETYCPKSPEEWREWLEKHHEIEQSIWLIYYRSSTNMDTLTWSEAVDEALCFGWIDSTKKTIDDEKYMQYFSKRKKQSNWSRINKEKIEQLTEKGLMFEAGEESVKIAKENGSWNILDDIENLVMPDDLKIALNVNPAAMEFYENHSNSIKKGMLYWVKSAKRTETREKRISEIVSAALMGKKPKHFG